MHEATTPLIPLPVSIVEFNLFCPIISVFVPVLLIVLHPADNRSPFGERMSAGWRTFVRQLEND